MIMHMRTLGTLVVLCFLGCGAPVDAADTAEGGEAVERAPLVLRPDDNCEVVDAWIAARAPEGLPTTYEELARLPPNYRLGIFDAVTPERRADIVRMQADRYARLHPNLSASERALLDEAMEILTPEVYANGPTPRTRDFEARALSVFGDRLETEVFRLLRAEVAYSERAMAPPVCNCNSIKNDCLMAGGTCKYGLIPCDWRARGCGPAFQDSCNGICVRW